MSIASHYLVSLTCFACSVEGQVATAVTSDAEEATTTDDNEDTETLSSPAKQPPAPADTRSFAAQAIAIVRAKRWQVYQGHVSTQVALGGSNFVYFFWCVLHESLVSTTRLCRCSTDTLSQTYTSTATTASRQRSSSAYTRAAVRKRSVTRSRRYRTSRSRASQA